MNNNQFHAIIVKCKEASCDYAKRYQGKKVLTTEFERDVLLHCHNTNCPCEFEQFNDRRTGNKDQAEKSQGKDYRQRSTDVDNDITT